MAIERRDFLKVSSTALGTSLLLGVSQAEANVGDVAKEESRSELESQQTKLQKDLEDLETSRGMEAALRQQYAVAGAGEGLIVIVEPDKPISRQASSSPWQWIAKIFHW